MPPRHCMQTMIMRFSRYYKDPHKFGLLNVRPWPGYRYLSPLSPEELRGLAYYFECDYADGAPQGYVGPVSHAVAAWKEQWSDPEDKRPRLDLYRAGRSAFLVIDTRLCAVKQAHRLEGIEAQVYLRCDSARSVKDLACEFDGLVREEEIREMLAKLISAGLMWQDGERFLSLALFHNRDGCRKDRSD